MPPADASAPDHKWLVQDDRIHASLYTDPRVFTDELERIGRTTHRPRLAFLI